jgi:hypothetical protein
MPHQFLVRWPGESGMWIRNREKTHLEKHCLICSLSPAAHSVVKKKFQDNQGYTEKLMKKKTTPRRVWMWIWYDQI